MNLKDSRDHFSEVNLRIIYLIYYKYGKPHLPEKF
jgi:hypothetical protein